MEERSWFHPTVSAVQAEQLLMSEGKPGSFLVRYSQSTQGCFSLSVRLTDSVTHVKINNDGDCYDLTGGETFATLSELICWYMEGGGGYGSLKEKDGRSIELKYPLPTSDHSTERFFHHDMMSKEADDCLKGISSPAGTFLVRRSQSQADSFVLSVKTGKPDPAVLHVIINYKNDLFDIGDGNKFRSLAELVNHYRTHPMKDRSGIEIILKQAFDMTHLKASDIHFRVAQLEKEFQCAGIRRDGFWEEFEHLQSQEYVNSKTVKRSHGEKPENKRKNRFKNILPYDHTRVKLADGDPKVAESDYINANYLQVKDDKMPGKMRRYIAAQGCLQHTIVDFWRLILQEKCSVVVMITKMIEDGKNKCVQYWPDETEDSKVFDVYNGTITVTFQGKIANNDYIKHTLMVEKKIDKGKSKGTTSGTVHHYQFLEWPDKRIPKAERTDSILAFINDINDKWKETKYAGPLTVHCSAGIGRTGTFIVIDSILNQIKGQGMDCEIDIAKTILHLRGQRSGLVQTELQYKFIYLAIKRHIELRQTGRPPSSPSASAMASNSQLYANVASSSQTVRPAAPVLPKKPPTSPTLMANQQVYENLSSTLSQAGLGKTVKQKPK